MLRATKMSKKHDIVFWLGLLFSLIALVVYVVTLYLLEWEELDSGTDLSYSLSVVEMCVSIGLGLTCVYVFRQKGGNIQTALIFFVLAFVFQVAVTSIRATNLGFFGEVENSCSDTGKETGCPTTRFEHVHDREITYREPKGGDCTFWFWGVRPESAVSSSGSMKRLADMGGSSSYRGISLNDIETYMDWSEPESYGHRIDPDLLQSLTDSLTDQSLPDLSKKKRIFNMEHLLELQESITGLTDEEKYATAPSLEYCWYWGCNAVCNHERFVINRVWFWLSVLESVLTLVYCGLTYSIFQHVAKDNKKDTNVQGADAATDVGEGEELLLPVYGRRKRLQNPSSLMF